MQRLQTRRTPSRVFSLSAALTSALLLSLAMPGHVGWWPLLFVGLVPLLYAVLHLPPMRCVCMGFFTGLVYHIVLLYWIVIVLGRYGGLPPWIAVPAMVLLASYMSCYLALFCVLLGFLAGRYRQRERSVATLVWTAPVLWVGLDYLRGTLMTGFPWMDLGYGLYGQPQLIQAADLGGHHLITFSLVLCNGLIVAIIDRQHSHVRWNIRLERRVLLAAGCFLVFVGGYSLLRYQVMPSVAARALQAEVAVVQGNIDQKEKWTPGKKAETVETYRTLSRRALADKTTELLVWPETALPFYPQLDPLAAQVTDFTRRENVWLLTGAPAFTRGEYAADGEGKIDYFNSALLINPSGEVAGRYSKQHLVPFGEYVPLRSYLPFLEPLVVSVGDFTAGSSSRPLVMERMKLGVLICFESIFPEIARNEAANGANLLVNLTNDAWYGRSSAPYQSMSMAVFRAVETKRSLIRAANTGISGFVDPSGNILKKTGLFEETFVSARVPILEKQTVFTRSGWRFGAVCLALIPVLLIFQRRK
ncbi:MAG: apolipoprotein N-acyltransferase [Desulfobulbaceae bacterium]|nr:apolipoprotein N-acyltransferase [Desulfobulbaceae bacterium]